VNAEPRDGRDSLAQLRKEERSISARRTRLHNRLDFLRAGRDGEGAEDLIRELERQEEELSLQRRDLHERIERASAQLAAGRG
jgi:chromosome segregation ATPase